jgi:hypothetical protein
VDRKFLSKQEIGTRTDTHIHHCRDEWGYVEMNKRQWPECYSVLHKPSNARICLRLPASAMV